MDEPQRPSDSDCCNSGCNPCILDVYEEQLKKFNSISVKDKTTVKNCLSPISYTTFKLIDKVPHAKDVFLFTFKCESFKGCDVGLVYEPGQHFLLKGHSHNDETNQFTRAYTPIPLLNDDELSFTVVIKLYDCGVMSKYLRTMDVNSESLWRGPYGNYEIVYTHSRMLLIAQGTGIAPLFALINDLLNNVECETFLDLYFCCRTEGDILLRDELYKLSSFWNFSYKVFLSAGNSEDVQCKYNETLCLKRLNRDELQSYFINKICSNIKVLICGSEDFNKKMSANVGTCGIDECNIFTF